MCCRACSIRLFGICSIIGFVLVPITFTVQHDETEEDWASQDFDKFSINNVNSGSKRYSIGIVPCGPLCRQQHFNAQSETLGPSARVTLYWGYFVLVKAGGHYCMQRVATKWIFESQARLYQSKDFFQGFERFMEVLC